MNNHPTTTDRHMPLRMEHVVVLGDKFTPLQQRRIALAFNGKVTNKAQASAEGFDPVAIKRTWEHIADKLNLQWGHRTRQHIMAELCRRHLVQFICFVLVILPLLNAILGDDGLDMMRKRRGGRSRRGRFDNAIALDIDTLDEITDWPAWLQQQQQRQQANQINQPVAQTIATACTVLGSIAIGSTTGAAIYIATSWPGAGHTGTEIAAELAGCAVGLITHRRTSF
ncbi:MAG: hypothetical protein EP334_10230, partial [Gammaproteobacteria bacterium]